MKRLIFAILSFAVTGLLAYGGWGLYGRDQAMPDVPDGKLRCVSYAPYREGQSPFMENLVISREQIDEDLRQLSQRFDCVRTYSVNQGMAAVPEIAARHGLKVLLGVWIGRDRLNRKVNEKEIEIAVRLANDPANRDTIMAIVVGNEVLLRREFTARQMAEWIGMVKSQVTVPVTYADVWEFWLKYPSVAEAVDYLTVHILPYWEDDPVSLADSMSHMRDILAKMHAAFPGRKLFIGETGWPSAGRSREGAVPSPANQARYIREFVRVVGEEGIDYNVIEAFDQPWKRIQEGTVGGEWGIFDVARQQKFPFVGPVSDNPNWRTDAATGMAIAAVLLLSLAIGGYGFGLLGWMIAAFAAQAIGASLVRQWQFIAETSLNHGTWLVNFSSMVLSALAAVLLTMAFADLATNRAAGAIRPASMADTLAWLRRPRYGWFDRALTLGLLRLLTLFGATAIALQMLFDPRYRDFPTATYILPAIGFALLHWLQECRRPESRPTSDFQEELWLTAFLTVAALISGIREGFSNFESLAWMATILLVAAPWLHVMWMSRGAARTAALRGEPV